MSWLLHALGIDNTAGHWYAFWSGTGSDLGEMAVLGGLVNVVRSMVRHHAERLAQAAAHHRAVLDQAAAHHAAVTALAKVHHDDLKEHVSAVLGKGVTGG